MMLEIASFAEPGNHEKERLVIKALSDLDVGKYVVLVSTVSATQTPTSGRKTAYWFPDQLIKAGDLVVLYTKSGVTSHKKIVGGTAYFYYWGLTKPLWGTGQNTAVLARITEWIHKIS
jgi:hypothetical protein